MNIVRCACNHCSLMIQQYDNRGRLRRFIKGHNTKGCKFPLERHWHYKGGKYKQNGYIFIRQDNHLRAHKGYVQEHILIMEKHLGRYLTKDEEIHHINGIKDDNRIENLKLFTHQEHSLHHFKERWKRDKEKNKLNPPCPNCYNTDVRREGYRKTLTEKKQRYLCNKCKKTFSKKEYWR